jgi:prepilin-type N-terminal cleavage/methylation domain-containing protein
MKGFTIVEILVVIAVSAMLSALAITYTNVGRNQIALSVESAKISQFILQAKELSIATYSGSGASCAYGVFFDLVNQSYSIFSYNPAGAPPCPTASAVTSIGPNDMAEYTPGTWNVKLSRGISMSAGSAGDSIQYVMFYPPAPTTIFVDNGTDGLAYQTSYVYLSTIGNTASTNISVNPAGQVSL